MLVEDEIYTVDQLDNVLSTNKSTHSSQKNNSSEDNKQDDSDYKWKDFFIDFSKYKE
ncbi:hypothetical protein [Halanaerobium hydrogeniformans]|uniref:hypothetical protein n=1 Tax=Halanaerobium hydrogeniformans TaxID=656519 RepID=UPI0002D825AA|nr:hypothetical protein [Halanaerobium hydrogeniformans]